MKVSLNRRILAGAILWTIGLFIALGIAHNFVLLRHPRLLPHVIRITFDYKKAAGAIAVLCLGLGVMQVRRGMNPITQLRTRLGDVHRGEEARVTGDYPAEVQPLVDDLNELLDERERRVARAVARAGDLAHGLKTPLAILAGEAQRARAAGHDALADDIDEQVARMRAQIDRHLVQARSAASAVQPGARVDVAESAAALIRTMRQLHADRGLTFDADVDRALGVRVAREDLDEMLGNLLDNASKWAHSRVVTRAAANGATVTIDVDDDGPGIPGAMREAVLARGVRADETAQGTGLGLAIVRDLADVYGGQIALTTSPLGGARATLTLPRDVIN